MGLNLHGLVRGAVGAVNPDREVTYQRSTGYTRAPGGVQVPAYAADELLMAQIQPLSREDLKHPAFTNVQSLTRSVHLFGNVQGVVRPDAKGGDLLLFAQTMGGTVQTWKVAAVLETWAPDTAGWCRVGVVLQVDA